MAGASCRAVAVTWLVSLAVSALAQDTPLASLEPAAVWRHFGALCRLPRCSGFESAAAEYVRRSAESQGLEVLADSVGNLLIKRPGWPVPSSEEGAEPVVLHTHLDMACAADHDDHSGGAPRGASSREEPVEVTVRDDGWAVSEKASLGADGGVGVAVALALLEEPSDTPLPPLELLFTVQGRSGGLGALGLNASLLSGRRLLNLDAEEHGVLFAGAAGSRRAKLRLPVATTALRPGSRSFVLALRGLSGGHSGSDAHRGGASALAALARAVARVRAKVPFAQLASLTGGGRDDAIPKEASAVFGFPLSELARAREAVAEAERELAAEFGRTDPHLQLRLEQPEHASDIVLSEESAERLLDLLLLLPLGALRTSPEAPGSVETSVGLARVRQEAAGMLEVLVLTRSSQNAALEGLRDRIDRLASRVVATAAWGASTPAWAPNRGSALLAAAQEAFRKVEGRTPSLAVAHAGLEVAAIKEKIPEMDMVSYGPDVVGARAPGECVKVDSVEKTWELTRRLLSHFAAGAEADAQVDL